MSIEFDINGELPLNKNILLASADSNYILKYAAVFVNSGIKNYFHIHLNIVNINDEALVFLSKLKNKFKNNLTYTFMEVDLNILNNDIKLKTFYACSRFLCAEKIFNLSHCEFIYILDIDSIVRKSFNFNEYDLLLYKRKPIENKGSIIKNGTEFAAGFLGINRSATKFLKVLNKALTYNVNLLNWYYDQICIKHVYDSVGKYFNIKYLTSDQFDWEFNYESNIWTGKGNRKYNDSEYIQEFNRYQIEI